MSTLNEDTKHKDGRSGLKKPFMLAYTVKPIGDGQKSVWTKLGAAWAHRDGEGFDVQMDAIPVDGRLVLRTVRDEDADQSGEVLRREPG